MSMLFNPGIILAILVCIAAYLVGSLAKSACKDLKNKLDHHRFQVQPKKFNNKKSSY